MESRTTLNKQKTSDSPLSYYQIYEYATTQDASIKENLKNSINNVSAETARKNLDVISGYTHIYCAEDNNPLKQIASETYEWAYDYSSKGMHFITDGFQEAGGQQSLLATVLGLTIFGGGGGILGSMAGTAHAIYALSSGMTLNPAQKNDVLLLQQIAKQQVDHINQNKIYETKANLGLTLFKPTPEPGLKKVPAEEACYRHPCIK